MGHFQARSYNVFSYFGVAEMPSVHIHEVNLVKLARKVCSTPRAIRLYTTRGLLDGFRNFRVRGGTRGSRFIFCVPLRALRLIFQIDARSMNEFTDLPRMRIAP